jgi:hypothetical protein
MRWFMDILFLTLIAAKGMLALGEYPEAER